MSTLTLIQRLTQEFPGHTFTTKSLPCPEDLAPRVTIVCDGVQLQLQWFVELMYLEAYHDINIKREVYDVFIKEVSQQICKNG